MKNILVISDSCSLPRSKPEFLYYDETYPRLLEKKTNIRVISHAVGAATVVQLLNQSHYYDNLYPEVLVIQSGIVDCAPRALSPLELQLVGKFSVLSYITRKIIGIDNLRKRRNICNTPPTVFGKHVKKISSAFPNAKKIWIGIVPPSEGYELKLKGITRRINEFNQILKEECPKNNFIYFDISSIPKEGIMSDFHHFSKAGHEWLATELSKRIVVD